jgi:hypothetical protein
MARADETKELTMRYTTRAWLEQRAANSLRAAGFDYGEPYGGGKAVVGRVFLTKQGSGYVLAVITSEGGGEKNLIEGATAGELVAFLDGVAAVVTFQKEKARG